MSGRLAAEEPTQKSSWLVPDVLKWLEGPQDGLGFSVIEPLRMDNGDSMSQLLTLWTLLKRFGCSLPFMEVGEWGDFLEFG